MNKFETGKINTGRSKVEELPFKVEDPKQDLPAVTALEVIHWIVFSDFFASAFLLHDTIRW